MRGITPHLRIVREQYALRRNAMIRALEQFAPPGVNWNAPAGGYYIWSRLPPSVDVSRLAAAAARRGVSYLPGNAFLRGRRAGNDAHAALLRRGTRGQGARRNPAPHGGGRRVFPRRTRADSSTPEPRILWFERRTAESGSTMTKT